MARVTFTYEDYAALPDDGQRYEVLDGDLVMTPTPSTQHQIVVRNFFVVLHEHVASLGLGELLFAPLDVVLSATTVVQPDIVFLASPARARLTERGVEGPPTLVVEVLSPGTASRDRGAKRRLYARYGVPYLWFVDSGPRTLDALVLGRGGYTLAAHAAGDEAVTAPPFDHVRLALASLWPRR